MGRRKKQTNEKFGVIDDKKPATPPVAPKPDTTMKDYMDILRYQTKQRNGLLGNFSADGKYSIRSKEILDHLLSTPKKFEEKIDGTVYASAKKGDFVINFKIDFDISPDYCTAKLYLIEVEHGVEKDIKHVTELDDLVAPYSATFNEDAYKQWKVWKDTPVYKKDDYLFEILAMMKEEYLFNKELTDLLSQLYMVRMLEFLGKCGELGEKTRADYQRLVDRMLKKDPSLAQDFARLKLILDEVIKKNNLYKEIEKTEEGKKLLNGYALPLKKFKETATVLEIRRPKNKEKVPVQEPEKTSFDKKVERAKETVKPTVKNPAGYTFSPIKGDTLTTFADLIKDVVSILPGAQIAEILATVGGALENKELQEFKKDRDALEREFIGADKAETHAPPGPRHKEDVPTQAGGGTTVTFIGNDIPTTTVKVDNQTKPNHESFNEFAYVGAEYAKDMKKRESFVKNDRDRTDRAEGLPDGTVNLENSMDRIFGKNY